MEFKIRPLHDGDYEEILVKWWKQWRWTAPEKDFLPHNGNGGLIVYDGDTPVCAGFVYITNSKVCWVDWIISNVEYKDRDNRKEAITFLIDSLTTVCKNSGAKYVYALIKNKSLIETYQDVGYIKADNYNQEMIKVL